nr:probable 1-deoxy-D-xylulose-5-phosphate synthase 2, chloroplastic [Tanacetum cinerariifolium]
RDRYPLEWLARQQIVLGAARGLRYLHKECRVVDAWFYKPLDAELNKRLANEDEVLLTVEEGSIGRFGSHVAHFLSINGLLDEKLKRGAKKDEEKTRCWQLPWTSAPVEEPPSEEEVARKAALWEKQGQRLWETTKALNMCILDCFDIKFLSLVLGLYLYCRLVPSCFVIFDLEPLSLSFDFIFESKIFKYLSFSLDRLCHLAVLGLDQHAHTLHRLESSLIISLDRLDILRNI